MSSGPLEPLNVVYHENLSIYTHLMVLMGPCSDYRWYSWRVYTYYLGQKQADLLESMLMTNDVGDGRWRQEVFMMIFDVGDSRDRSVQEK